MPRGNQSFARTGANAIHVYGLQTSQIVVLITHGREGSRILDTTYAAVGKVMPTDFKLANGLL
eukprot:9544924-Lingulodinium_polyedra.AAC.1